MSDFTHFALFPKELQLHVWHLALLVQEGNIVRIKQLRYGHPRKFKPHVLYFVNCDSRRIYLEFHKNNMALYPRMKIVVVDPRIDTVFYTASRRMPIGYILKRFLDSPQGSVLKDVRNFGIAGLAPRFYSAFERGLANTTIDYIVRFLPSVQSITYVSGDVDDSRGFSVNRNPTIGLATTLQGEISVYNEDSYELLKLLVEKTRARLEEIKKESPEWKIPRVQAMFAIREGAGPAGNANFT